MRRYSNLRSSWLGS